MKKIVLAIATLALTLQAHAELKITDPAKGGLLFGFLATMESPQNAGDGVLLVSADVSCALHKNKQVYCMSSEGGITGEIAEELYLSFSPKSEEQFDDVTVRRGHVACASIEESGKAPRYNCF
ncbi:hypothetical protein ACLWBD_02805 [Bdellovibrio sp. HCB117]|uniref:hypothetical protein n=1 Tax=Bdellovibrio sp. HCB117 TaxID=3394359 RepID=UPI0039B5C57D